RRAELRAGLPPAVLADDDARVEIVVEARAGAHAAIGRLDRHPLADGDATRRGRARVQFDLWVERALAQARQRALLRLTEQGRLRAGQDEREARREIGPRHRADRRLLE